MVVGQRPDLKLDGLLELQRGMLRIRRFEERAAQLYRDGEIPGFVHLSIGQEAVAVGTCSVLLRSDGVVSNHRGHGHCLAKGVDMAGMFAELMGRESGTCHGRGGSMHIADVATGVYGANGIVGAGLPIATGIGAAFQIQGRDDVVVAFFGEGAAAQGAFHEAVNLAAVWHLPVLFLCENNGFAEFARLEDQQARRPSERATAYGIPGRLVDGNDVLAVRAAVETAVDGLRSGQGPVLIEATTFRWRGHYEGDPERYRTPDEVAAGMRGDPLVLNKDRIQRLQGRAALEALEAEVTAEVEAAVEAARSGPAPAPETAAAYTLVDWVEPGREHPGADAGDTFRYMDGVREALAYELEHDPSVWIAGIDVGAGGGVFAATRGLAERFPGRVRDTPISETAVMGLAVGGAMAGSKPVVELMYVDFLGVCLDQVLNQAAKMHFMTGGAASTSLVIRTQCGAGRSSGPQHSQSLESIFAQIPGLKVVMPADAADAYGLLRAAIHDPNPVVFIENRLLYGRKSARAALEHVVPLGRAAVRRPGTNLTVVTWSRMVHDVLEAAEIAAKSGVDAEVIDLRTVAPFDRGAIAESVGRTHRLLVAHEAVMTSGIGAEITGWAADELFWDLDAPVRRVAPPFSPVPYAPELEHAWLPDVSRIATAMSDLIRV
jgi:2-oxoisovalerate dehydrogenase E1 component